MFAVAFVLVRFLACTLIKVEWGSVGPPPKLFVCFSRAGVLTPFGPSSPNFEEGAFYQAFASLKYFRDFENLRSGYDQGAMYRCADITIHKYFF